LTSCKPVSLSRRTLHHGVSNKQYSFGSPVQNASLNLSSIQCLIKKFQIKILLLVPALPKMYEITLSGAQRLTLSLISPSGSHFSSTVNHSLNLFKYSHIMMGTKHGKFGDLNQLESFDHLK